MIVRPAELAATLVDRARQERERERERARSLAQRLRAALRTLRGEGVFARAWLIGSLAWGGFGRRSDADIVVLGADPSRIVRLAALLSDVAGIWVDVLRMEELPRSFRRRVLEDGVSFDEP